MDRAIRSYMGSPKQELLEQFLIIQVLEMWSTNGATSNSIYTINKPTPGELTV